MRRWVAVVRPTWSTDGVTQPEGNTTARRLAALLASASIAHFVIPRYFDRIVPRALPGSARTYTVVSGIAELGCAAAIALPRTRRFGAGAAAVLFVLVFPANIQMALDAGSASTADRALAYGRLPLQLPLVLWALVVRRRAGRRAVAAIPPGPRPD